MLKQTKNVVAESLLKYAAANILKNKKKIREQYEQFHDKTKKGGRILCYSYQKCCSSGLYPNGLILRKEAMEIKEQLQDSRFDGLW